MTDVQLRVLIDSQVRASLTTAFARRTDRLTDKMIDEMFKDEANRREFQQLVRTAFARALESMSPPAQPRRREKSRRRGAARRGSTRGR